ncbi:MAG TPA: hypothetical protein VMF59_10345 [Bacteroidota bacterium]|nr:hypothetical protein [Bacteroidota bacterium]
MSTEEKSGADEEGERPIGINSRRVFLAVVVMMIASILLLLVIRYAFL